MQRVEQLGMAGRQIDRGPSRAALDGADLAIEGVLHLMSEGLRLALAAVDRPLRLAREVRPAAQPLGEVTIGRPAVAHQPAGEEAVENLAPALGHHEQGDGGTGEDP
jgi:hypothetical protein